MFLAALSLSAVSIFSCGYLGTPQAAAIALVSVGIGANGLINAGMVTNIIDLAPQYAGILMGLCNTVGTVPGMIGPIIVEAIAHAVSKAMYFNHQ